MRRKLVLLIIFIIYSYINVFGISLVNLWERRYKNAKDMKERRDVVESLSKKVTIEYEPLILQILKDQAYFAPDKDPQTFRFYEDIVYYVADMMINLKIKKASDDLILMYRKMINPLHLGMIAEAIGMVNEKKDLLFLNEELRLINIMHRTGKYKDKDRQLYGIIRGLEYYNDRSSFTDLFYAAIPNYGKNIQDEAVKAITAITKDTAPLCKQIIEEENDPRIIFEALNYSYKSESSAESKISAAQSALAKGVNYEIIDPTTIALITTIKDDSAKFLGELKSNDVMTLQLLEKKWMKDTETSSRLATVEALQSIGSEEAGKLLAKWMNFFVERKKIESSARTAYKDEDKIIIAVIKALGVTKGEAGIEELFDITPIFGNPIVDEARKSLQKKGITQ